jgi:hypothetical protein
MFKRQGHTYTRGTGTYIYNRDRHVHRERFKVKLKSKHFSQSMNIVIIAESVCLNVIKISFAVCDFQPQPRAAVKRDRELN